MDDTSTEFINEKLIGSLRYISLIGAIIVTFLSITTLIGWQFNIGILERTIPGQTPTNPLEAICLVLLSTTLLIQLLVEKIQLRIVLSILFASITIVINALLFLGDGLGLNFSLDQLLFTNKLVGNTLAPNASINFIMLGISLIFLSFHRKYFSLVAQGLALIAAFISLFGVFGYIYQILIFYKFSSFPPMALNTALAFSFLSISTLLTKPVHGFMRILVLNTFSSTLAFRIIIALLTIPPAVGILILAGYRLALYDTNMAIALVIIANILIFTIIVWMNTYFLQRLELEQMIMKEELKRKNIKLELDTAELSKKILQAGSEKENTINRLIEGQFFTKTTKNL